MQPALLRPPGGPPREGPWCPTLQQEEQRVPESGSPGGGPHRDVACWLPPPPGKHDLLLRQKGRPVSATLTGFRWLLGAKVLRRPGLGRNLRGQEQRGRAGGTPCDSTRASR